MPGGGRFCPVVQNSCIPPEALAYEAGINRTYLSKLEKGASYAGLEIIGTLADVLEVSELLREPGN